MDFDGFPRRDPSFDPTKYSTKSKARATAPTMTLQESKAESSALCNISPIERVPEQPRQRLSPGSFNLNMTTTTTFEATCSITFKHSTTTKRALTVNEKVAPQPQLSPRPQLTQHRLLAPDNKPTHTETETTDATDTLRLVSLRRINKLYHAKVEARWFTLAELEGGWVSMVPGRVFKEGDLVLYIEIDAFLPASDSRFGKSSHLQMIDGKLGQRVKTRRFGSGQNNIVVQGLVYPIEKFELIHDEIKMVKEMMGNTSGGPGAKPSPGLINTLILAMYRNENWAAKLGIRKWEESRLQQPVQQVQHPKMGSIPTRLFKKTNISRLEDCPNLFSKAKYNFKQYQESVKMDGCSMTVYFVKDKSRLMADLNPLPEEVGPNTEVGNGRFGVCSKSVDLNELNQCSVGYWKTALRYDLPAKLSKLNRSVAISGELCGGKINKNREKIPEGEVEFFVYSMWDIAAQKYVNSKQVVAMAERLGLKHVPVLGYVKLPEICKNHQELKKRAAQQPGEGLIYKCLEDGRAFKVISSTYLLEHNL